MENVVEKYKLRPYIHLRHELTHAQWDADKGKWSIRIRRGVSDASPAPNVKSKDEGEGGVEEFDDTCDVLLLCVGSLNRWHWPDIDGLNEVSGTVLHSAQWSDLTDGRWEEGVKDWGDKAVGVIGNVCISVSRIDDFPG